MEASDSLYHRLPETTETQLAKQLRDIYSEVRDGQVRGLSVHRAQVVTRARLSLSLSCVSGEVQRRGEEGGGEEPVLAPPRDGGDAVCQTRV